MHFLVVTYTLEYYNYHKYYYIFLTLTLLTRLLDLNSFIFINGVQVASGSISNVAISKPFVFNTRWENNGVAPSPGDSRQSQFAQMYVYNRALTASEIVQNYNATKRRYGL